MTAVQDFLQTEWKENERAIAKQTALRDLQETLKCTLRNISDAEERLRTEHRKPGEMNEFYRFAICAVVWIPWFWILVPFVRLTGFHGDLGPFVILPLAVGATVAAWNTPEIVFTIKERLRVSSVRNQAQTDHDTLSKQAEDIRQQIKATKAEKYVR